MISVLAEFGFTVQNGCRVLQMKQSPSIRELVLWEYAVPVCAQGIIKTKATGEEKKKNVALSN